MITRHISWLSWVNVCIYSWQIKSMASVVVQGHLASCDHEEWASGRCKVLNQNWLDSLSIYILDLLVIKRYTVYLWYNYEIKTVLLTRKNGIQIDSPGIVWRSDWVMNQRLSFFRERFPSGSLAVNQVQPMIRWSFAGFMSSSRFQLTKIATITNKSF